MNAFAHFFNVYILLYKFLFVKPLCYEKANKADIIFVVLDEYLNEILQDFIFKNSKQAIIRNY